MVDAPTESGWLLDLLGNRFQLLALNAKIPEKVEIDNITIETLCVDINQELKQRYLGDAESAVYLIRPDQHVAARWVNFDEASVATALRKAIGLS